MDHIETADYLVRMLDHDNKDELREVQKLRYDYLLRDFDENKNDSDGLDDDGYDAFSESLIAVEKKTGRIVGTYRVATDATLKGGVFKCEEEFDISSLRKDIPTLGEKDIRLFCYLVIGYDAPLISALMNVGKESTIYCWKNRLLGKIRRLPVTKAGRYLDLVR